MAIKFRCSGCDQVLKVADDYAGKQWMCNCGKLLDVPPESWTEAQLTESKLQVGLESSRQRFTSTGFFFVSAVVSILSPAFAFVFILLKAPEAIAFAGVAGFLAACISFGGALTVLEKPAAAAVTTLAIIGMLLSICTGVLGVVMLSFKGFSFGTH